MALALQPFPLCRTMPPRLTRAHRTWQRLIRAENTMPFTDDVDLAPLKTLSANLFLVDVISDPPRFRFNKLGAKIVARLGRDVTGKFADEVEPRPPFDYLIAQASATIEARAPTLYSSSAARKGNRGGYARIMLPAWGNGRVDLLLGAIV
jgi:hypothetical protein